MNRDLIFSLYSHSFFFFLNTPQGQLNEILDVLGCTCAVPGTYLEPR